MPGRKVATPEINALLELERRDMQQPGTMPPALKARLDSYRQQGVVAPIGGGKPPTGEQSTAAGLYSRAVRANRQYETIPEADRQPRGLLRQAYHDALPSVENTYSNTPNRQVSDSNARDFITATLRKESGAAISASEFQNQYRIFFPQPGDSKQEIENKRLARQQEIESLRAAAGSAAETVKIIPGDATGTTEAPGKRKETMIAPGAPGGAGAAGLRPDAPPDDGTGGGTPTITPRAVGHSIATAEDKKFAAIAQAAFDHGASREEMDSLAKAFGAPAYGPDLDAAIAYRQKGGKGAQILASKTGHEDPGFMQRALAPLAASPVGAAMGGFANGALLGGLDEAAGAIETPFNGKPISENIADVNRQKQVARAANPKAFAAGEVGGGVATSLAAGGAGGLRATGALGARALGTDAAIGATYGGLENNDNRMEGAAVGGLTGVAGGVAGRGVMNRVAGAISPKVAPAIAFLRDKGVRLTPGQAAGDTANAAEQKLMILPGAGDLIRNGRKRALSDFNTGYLNDSLSHIGATLPDGHTGTKAMGFAQNAFNAAYDKARSGMQLVPDSKLAQDLNTLDQSLANGGVAPDIYDRVGKIFANKVLPKIKSGTINGSDYKDMVSQLGKIEDTAKRSQNFELSGAISDIKATLDDAARRSSPPAAVAAMDATDRGYALFVRAENAAKRKGGETGTFTPSGLDAAVQAGDSSVRSKAFLRGDALGQEWSDAGKTVLKDTVPDSGTAGRLALGAAAGGVGYLHPATLAPLASLSAIYAPGVRDAVTAALIKPRGPIAETVAEGIRKRALLGSAATSPLALVYEQNGQ